MHQNPKFLNVHSERDEPGAESRGRGWALRGPSVAVVCATVLLLFGGKAWGNDECGVASGTGVWMATCTAAQVANGVRYWDPNSVGITLKIPGVSGSPTTITSEQTENAGVTIKEAGPITLEIGTAGPVAIRQNAQSGAVAAHGILLRDQGAMVTHMLDVTVAQGVTIGTQTARMLENGIQLDMWTPTTVDHSIKSGATIYAAKNGISVASSSTGKISLENTGAITAGEKGIQLSSNADVDLTNRGTIISGSDTATEAHGINVQRWNNAMGDDVTVTNYGAITAMGTTTHGIRVEVQGGPGDITVTNDGAISAGTHGIYVDQRGPGDVMVTNRGAITAGGQGINLDGKSKVELTNHGVIISGSATATEAHGINVNKASGTGGVMVTNSGAITAMGTTTHGIRVRHAGMETVTVTGGVTTVTDAVTVTNSGDITAPEYGIYVDQIGTGAVTVTNSGAITGTVHGIYVRQLESVSDITIETSGDITSDVYGIFADLTGGGGDGENARTSNIDVTVREGATVTGGNGGIYVKARGLGENDNVKNTVTVHGTVTGGKDDGDAAVTLERGGRVMVGRTGTVKAGRSALAAIVSKIVQPENPPEDYEPEMGDLDVMVAGMVMGHIRVEDAGNLTATVSGTVMGDVRTMGGGTLTLAVPEGGTITGTAYDPVGPLTVAGSIGRLMYTNGGTVTVAQTGRITGVDGETAAIQSADGDLDVTVAGTVTGDVLSMGNGDLDATVSGMVDGDVHAMGNGDHTVNVRRGGTVTGTVNLAGSTVTVDGTVGRITLADNGMVMVSQTGRVTGGPGVHGVHVGVGGDIVNRGTIAGKIGIIIDGGDSTVVNSGTVRSTDGADGVAFAFTNGRDNTLTLQRGMTVVGKIKGLSGNDTVNLTDLTPDEVGILTFVNEDDTPANVGNLRLMLPAAAGIGHVLRGGDSIVSVDVTAFALADDMLSDLTGAIHGAVVERGMIPGLADSGRSTVWATPFGGARDQKGSGTVADGTHSFGGGMIGTSWSSPNMRVGGFLGGSVGMIDVDSGQTPDVDMQTIFGGLYVQRAVGDGIYDARLVMGRMTHESARRVLGMNTAEVEYHSFFFSPEVGAATTMRLTETLNLLPRVRVRYAGLFTNGFRESGSRQLRNWDVQFQDRTVSVLEGRAEVGVPWTLSNGGQINPRVGVEGRWLLSGSEIRGSMRGESFNLDAGGDDQVVTGTVGVGLSVPVADSTTLIGSFDGALTTEDAWRALGYLGLSYSF